MERSYTRESEITIIYVAGYGRSGSTLLDILLSNVDGVVGLGELSNFFELCGDAETERKLSEGFWGGVKREAASCLQRDGDKKEVFKEADKIQRKVERFRGGWRHIPLLGGKILKRYQIIIDCLFHAIANTDSQNNIFVDSSKTAWLTSWRPYCLHKIGYRVKVIHLVRDGRGVITSFLKGDDRKLEKGLSDASFKLPVTRSVAGWIFANISAYVNSKLLPEGNSFLLRYEDLVRDTEKVLGDLGVFLEVDFSHVIAKLSESEGLQNKNVSFSGNRMRKSDLLTINTESVKPPTLKKLHSLFYWAAAGWLHCLIYCRGESGK